MGKGDEDEQAGWSWWVRRASDETEQLAGHGGKIGACDDTKPIGWSRWGRRGM